MLNDKVACTRRPVPSDLSIESLTLSIEHFRPTFGKV
jgi:hypothetical protein